MTAHATAEFDVIRTMDDGPDYRVHVAVTSAGFPAKLGGLPENNYPAEGPEYEVTGIDGETWTVGDFLNPPTRLWVPIETTHNTLECAAVNSWAESLDLYDECMEALTGEREAHIERQDEYRRDAIDELWHERNQK